MRPGEKAGAIVLETHEELEVVIESLERRIKEVDDRTATSMKLVSESLDDVDVPISIGVEPSKLILEALECARSAPTAIGLQSTTVYEDYRKKVTS